MRSLLVLMFCPLPALTQEFPSPEAGWQGEKVCEVLVENESVRTFVAPSPGIGQRKHYHPKHVGYTLAGGTFRITDAKGTREVNIPEGYTFYNEEVPCTRCSTLETIRPSSLSSSPKLKLIANDCGSLTKD